MIIEIGAKDIDLVGEWVGTNRKIIFEFKHGKSPSGKQRKKFIKQMRARAALIADESSEFFQADLFVELSGGQNWSPALRKNLNDLVNEFGISLSISPPL